MKKTTSLLLIVLVTIVSMTGLAAASTLEEIIARGTLRIGLAPGYVPFEMVTKRGDIVGFDIDLGKRMAKALGVKLEVVSTDFDGIIPSLLTGKFDIAMTAMTITPQRAEAIDFSEPYIVVGQTALLRKGLVDEVKSVHDLNDSRFRVASTIGTTGEFAAKRTLPKAQYFSYETQQECVVEVMNSKIDAFIYDSPYNAVAYARMGSDKLVFLDEPFTHEPLGWGIVKGNPELLAWMNNFLLEIKGNGTYDKIYKKWFKSARWQKQLQ